jgi:flagellar basal-body rod modification protein FlgD
VEQAATVAASNDTIDQEQFLLLFVEQLQNQDPLNPLDVNGMTEQLAQFSSLEQLFAINDNIESLAERLDSGQTLDPLGFLGADVTVPGDTITVAAGEVSGLMLDVPAEAAGVEVTITGEAGQSVRQIALGPQPAGELDLGAAGVDLTDLDDGEYTVSASGVADDGSPIDIATFIRGTVTGIDPRAQPPVLLLGDQEVQLVDVRRIDSASDEP